MSPKKAEADSHPGGGRWKPENAACENWIYADFYEQRSQSDLEPFRKSVGKSMVVTKCQPDGRTGKKESQETDEHRSQCAEPLSQELKL